MHRPLSQFYQVIWEKIGSLEAVESEVLGASLESPPIKKRVQWAA